MDLAIVMKAVLVASYFTALSLQVEHFLHPTKNLTRWTLEVRPRAMSTWTRRRLTQGLTRRKGWTTATGWWEARSATPGSPKSSGEKNLVRVFPFVVGWNQHGFPNQMSCSGEIQEISDQITFLWNGFHTKLLSQSNQIHMLWLFWSKLCSKVLLKTSDPSFTELR